ncbi:hypothetical protein GUA87_03155 [Sneathiella sp. P13V-1]|uniref:polysaccharide deacetylase family protein n=1 Tax=Sneathiella sp. P13V-1 TaxID=2697366 RepID=UPI00187B7001|nr:polysaccharide deacetylase family protein [Sneathiella sp. P13V-1]MBE7635825.1 hypothetical protein [Sneathiella sp. P13V-1]
MASWDQLQAELDQWEADGKKATFWWRDDDLNEPTPAFDRLIALRSHFDIPLTLAVIPDRVDPHIADDLDGCLLVQHGVTHQSEAKGGEKKSEFPESRGVEDALDHIGVGLSRMQTLFEDKFLPVFVPPWNRISDAVTERLGDIGVVGLSSYKARKTDKVSSNRVALINTHVDPIFWRGHRSALPEEEILDQVLSHLIAKRTGAADPFEPTGILSHHLVHDDAIWEILFKLFSFLNGHSSVRWMTYPGAMSLIDGLPDDIG